MTDAEARLLRELRRIGAWNLRGGSFEVHLDPDGIPSKIEAHAHYRLDKRLSTAEDIAALTDYVVS